ncbi:MAG: MarR family winged helix-turn-helix transcriptional regulator [Protaetiibacter sp.]
MTIEDPGAADAADRFDALFRRVYASFHRRDGVDRGLSAASRGVLTHLALAGPVTIGEAARHFDRAQSATSELISQLERNGLVERRVDPADARRTLVWLTGPGHTARRRDEAVLGLGLLADAFAAMPVEGRAAILDSLARLLEAAPAPGKEPR